jgi:hypothetical protein
MDAVCAVGDLRWVLWFVEHSAGDRCGTSAGESKYRTVPVPAHSGQYSVYLAASIHSSQEYSFSLWTRSHCFLSGLKLLSLSTDPRLKAALAHGAWLSQDLIRKVVLDTDYRSSCH